jgi:hypothetical protein
VGFIRDQKYSINEAYAAAIRRPFLRNIANGGRIFGCVGPLHGSFHSYRCYRRDEILLFATYYSLCARSCLYILFLFPKHLHSICFYFFVLALLRHICWNLKSRVERRVIPTGKVLILQVKVGGCVLGMGGGGGSLGVRSNKLCCVSHGWTFLLFFFLSFWVSFFVVYRLGVEGQATAGGWELRAHPNVHDEILRWVGCWPGFAFRLSPS